MKQIKDLTGKKIGKLTVLKLHHIEQRFLKNNPTVKNGLRYFYLCQCECENKIIVNKDNLNKLHTLSCGCLKNIAYHKTHGLSTSRLYGIWVGIKTRCYDSHCKSYSNYGLKNIAMCDEWKSDFMNFYNWAINNGYNDSLTIDRIDVNGNYSPSNCRWVDKITQANNKTNNHFITYKNETHTLAEWAKLKGLTYQMLQHRIRRKWDIEKALNTPRLR